MSDEVRGRAVLVEATLHARSGTPDGERVLEGRIVPFGVPSVVQDQDSSGRPVGRPYREVITGLRDFDPTRITLENGFGVKGGHRGPIAGRGIEGRAELDGGHVAFRPYRTSAGNDLYELAIEGHPIALSVEIEPDAEGTRTRRRPDGMVEREIVVRRVAALERGAYAGAMITAVRAESEGSEMSESNTVQAAVAGTIGEATPIGEAPASSAQIAPAEAEHLSRAAAERAQVAQLGRSSSPIVVTRDELVYGPTSGRSFLRDFIAMHEGDADAGASFGRHMRMLQGIADELAVRGDYADMDRIVYARTGVAISDRIMGRAGDVLSSEIPGAYPNTYLPGLLTPRILKGRPMGGFYQRVPISDARPQIFPKVTTSTTVAAQASEGVNPAASDFGTTAVTANPLLYGAETVLSRQVIDGGSPAAEGMVMDDMVEAYAQASEAIVKTAVEAGSTTSGVGITAATPFAGVQANVINYYGTRFKGAEGVFAPTAGFTTLLAENDTTGRPKLPWLGAVNSDGIVESGAGAGAMLGAAVKLSYASTVNVWVFGRSTDFVVFESPIARFSYDATTGPAGVRIGIWSYLVVGARLGSLKVTAA